MKQVSEIMSRKVVTISLSDAVITAARIMSENKIGGLIVVNNQEAVGVITESDLVRKVLLKNLDPIRIKVSDLLDRRLISIGSNASFYDAANLMVKNRIRRLPVVENGKLVGIVTAVDLAKQIANYSENPNITDIVNYWFEREEKRKKTS